MLSLTDREKLIKSARNAGAVLDVSDIFDGGFFISKLRRDGFWRKELLGLPSGPVTLSPVARNLAESPWVGLPLVARQGDLEELDCSDDVMLTGPVGRG